MQPSYLRDDQYGNANNLRRRQSLHLRFSTNPDHWFRWVFDQFSPFLTASARVLEIGAGNGTLWRLNADGVPPLGELCLTDFSPGMLDECRLAVPCCLGGIAGRSAMPQPSAGLANAVHANWMTPLDAEG